MSVFLTVNEGKIEIYPDMGIIDPPPVFVTDSAYEAARYLYDHGITDWQNSSSMDFSNEDGWPTKNACDEVMTHLANIHNDHLNRRVR